MANIMLKRKMLDFLEKNGASTTTTIYDYINNNTKWGSQKTTITNILTWIKEVEEVGNEEYRTFTGKLSNNDKIWRLKNL